jgi:hypothetical protein
MLKVLLPFVVRHSIVFLYLLHDPYALTCGRDDQYPKSDIIQTHYSLLEMH